MSTDDKRAARNLRRYLRGLTDTVTIVITALDEEMKRPSTPERGQRIAHICNALEMANDQARHFGLGQSLKPRKAKTPPVEPPLPSSSPATTPPASPAAS